MKNWRPPKWEEIKPHITGLDYAADSYNNGVEAGSNVMHEADVKWLRDRLKMTADGSIEIFCTQTDWEHFSGR